MRILENFKNQFSDSYELSYWVVLTFLGGALNSTVLWLYREYFHSVLRVYPSVGDSQISGQAFLLLIFPTIILIITPIILSFLLSKVQPVRHIIAPLHIQIITFGWYLFAFIHYVSPEEFVIEAMMLGILTFLVGTFHDKVINWFWGYGGDKSKLLNDSLLIDSDINEVRKIFGNEDNLELLRLSNIIKSIENGFRLRSDKFEKYSSVLDFTKYESSKTLLTIIVFQKGRYELIQNTSVQNHFHGQMDLIKGILSRNKFQHEKPHSREQVANSVNTISRELKGASSNLDKIPKLTWVRASAFIVALGVTGWLLSDKGMTEGVIALIVTFLLYVAYETRSIRHREKEITS